MDRRFRAFRLVGAAQRLAIDGDHIGQCRHGIKRRKNITEMAVSNAEVG
jgi:hypothetical protein